MQHLSSIVHFFTTGISTIRIKATTYLLQATMYSMYWKAYCSKTSWLIISKLCEIVFLLQFLSDFMIKLGYSEKATKFETIFRLKFDVTEQRHILSGRFFQILRPSQNI